MTSTAATPREGAALPGARVRAADPRRRERGFTLLELIVAMTVFGMVGLGIFGVLVLGGRSAGKGERVAEQARRYRIANDVLARQVAAAEPIQLPQPDEEGLSDDEDADRAQPFFRGEADMLEFVTTAPQRPDASGLSIVRYWVEDGMLKMSERPVFTAYAGGKKLDRAERDDSIATTLLYDVESVTFSYQRESDSDEWMEEWDARDEDQLPACVRIDVRPSAEGGPDFYHEIPVMVGTFNQIADADNDFRTKKVKKGGAPQVAPTSEDDSPRATATDPDDSDEE